MFSRCGRASTEMNGYLQMVKMKKHGKKLLSDSQEQLQTV